MAHLVSDDINLKVHPQYKLIILQSGASSHSLGFVNKNLSRFLDLLGQ